MRAVIFANGQCSDVQCIRELLRPDDLIIAADGGTRHALEAGVVPHVVIGDLDSLSPDERARVEACGAGFPACHCGAGFPACRCGAGFPACHCGAGFPACHCGAGFPACHCGAGFPACRAGAHIIRFSPHKDETDLELALQHAVRAGATQIIVLAALGGRLDQTIANLLLLALPELKGLDVRIVEGPQSAFFIHAGRDALIAGQPGDTVSLIPLGGDALGVTTEGLEWPLCDDPLRFGPARGVSNVLTAEQARVRVREGLLLCVVTHVSSPSLSGRG
jgi:thiamine pyrophosphokinase